MGAMRREAAAPRGFAEYVRTHTWVARHRPETLAAKTERYRAEVCRAEQMTRAEYREREAYFIGEVLRRRPQDVLDAGDYADALLVGYAAKVAHQRYCDRPQTKAA